jgi:glycosyltransferase involved in cell wall biosynthesis
VLPRVVPPNLNSWEEPWIPRLVSDAQIEFFLNIKPGTLTIDVPFLTVVWDLQHRLQPYFPEVTANGQWEARESFYSQVLRRATFVIAGTEAGKKEIEILYDVPEDRIRILPHPTPRFALEGSTSGKDELASYRLPPNYVFYPAQFWPHKNHVGLLRAIHHLKRVENISLPVVFVGSDHGNREHVRREAKNLNLEEQVFFLGYVSRAALCALYQKAFALCYVSFFGPENLPPLEAFALGCPVIAADVPGASEQFGDAAIRINPMNEIEIAGALQSLLRDPTKRAALITRGKERALRFTGTDFAKGLIALLDEFEAIRRCWN